MTRRANPASYVALVLVSFAAGIVLTLVLAPIRWDFPDNAHYAAMSSGTWRVADAGPVLEPFANRILAPILAGLVARASGLDVVSAMALINGVALGALGLLLAVWFQRRAVPLVVAATVAAMPIFGTLAMFLATVDALGILLATLVLLTAFENRRAWTPPLALIALLVRESLIAYYPFLLLRDLARRTWIPALALLGVVVLAKALIEFWKPYETSNVHAMSGLVYMGLKIPVNLLKNVLGVEFWTNTLAWCDAPAVVFDVRGLPGLGAVQEVGLCGWAPRRVLNTLVNFVCVFGVVPILVVRAGLRDALPRAMPRPGRQLDLVVAFWAAAFFFLLAPGLGSTNSGATLGRLFVHAIPCIIVLVPLLRPLDTGWWPLWATFAIGLAYRLALPAG